MNNRRLMAIIAVIIAIIISACSLFGVSFKPSETAEMQTDEIPSPTPQPTPTATQEPDPEWQFFKNEVLECNDDNKRLVIDQEGLVWFIGFGGVRTWDPDTNEYDMWSILEDGNESILSDLLIDENGVVWVASEEELFLFTGDGWTNYDAPYSEFVWEALAGGNNDIWVCAGNGVHRFTEDAWESFGRDQGLPDDYCVAMAMDPEGNPWVISAKNSLSHFENGWVNYMIDDKVLALSDHDLIDTSFANLHIGPGGEVWVMGLRQIVRFDQEGWFFDIVREGEGRIDAFGLGIHGEPWVSYYVDGASFFLAFDGELWQSMMSDSLENGIQNTTFNTILTAPNNAMWFLSEDMFIRKMLYGETVYMDAHGAWNPYQNKGFDFTGVSQGADLFYLSSEGIMEIDSGSRDVTVHKGMGELVSNEIHDLQIDSLGGVWTLHGEVHFDATLARFFEGETQQFFPGAEMSNFLIASDNTLWITQNRYRLFRSEPDWGSLVAVDKSDGLLNDVARSWIEDSRGNLWIGYFSTRSSKWGDGGASMWDGEQWNTYPCDQPGGPRCGGITSFYLAPDGTLFSNIYNERHGNICYYADGEWNQLPGSDELPAAIRQLLFNRWGNPIARIVDDPHYFLEYNPENASWDEFHVNATISTVEYINDTLWIGTDDGLYYRMDTVEGPGQLYRAPLDPLCGGEEIYVIASGNDGDIWMGTSGGVYLFITGETSKMVIDGLPMENGVWQAFSEVDAAGFVDVKFIALAPDGMIWFGSSTQGIASYGLP